MIQPQESAVSRYLSRWKLWTFDPESAAQVAEPSISTFQFFLGNIIGGLIGFLSIGFILAAELKTLKLSVITRLEGGSVQALLFAIFGTYVDTFVIATLISAIISFGMFRVSGSTISFKKHCKCYFEVSFLEPAGCLFFSYALIAAVTKQAGSLPIFATLALLWFGTRIWYCKVFWSALFHAHDIPPHRYTLAYWFGHIPAFLLTNMTLGATAWGLAGYFIISAR